MSGDALRVDLTAGLARCQEQRRHVLLFGSWWLASGSGLLLERGELLLGDVRQVTQHRVMGIVEEHRDPRRGEPRDHLNVEEVLLLACSVERQHDNSGRAQLAAKQRLKDVSVRPAFNE